jgi:hypothetical protein
MGLEGATSSHLPYRSDTRIRPNLQLRKVGYLATPRPSQNNDGIS